MVDEDHDKNRSLADIFPLADEQIKSFLRDGYLVIDDVLNTEEIQEAFEGLHMTLKRHGVDAENLIETAHNLKDLSSTNGSGGVLDIFYPSWKLKLCENEKMVAIMVQLWSAGFRHDENEWDQDDSEMDFRNHQFGPFDLNHAFMYIDRICYRIPSDISKAVGKRICEQDVAKSKKSNRSWPLQRSLTPHLDLCPDTVLKRLNHSLTKWRPIQSFISLTDNLEENTGGFECAPGFHRDFIKWARSRPNSRGKGGISIPPPCIGEFTPIRPNEDYDTLKRVKHIPCRAGSFVVWDNRLPHSNSRFNNSPYPRVVVYTSFLPDVDINRRYIRRQYSKYQKRQVSTDQWVERDESSIENEEEYSFSRLGRKLVGIDVWD